MGYPTTKVDQYPQYYLIDGSRNMRKLKLKGLTTAQRDALDVGSSDRAICYNNTTTQFEQWAGSSWATLGGLDYTEKWVSFNASGADSWVEKDLSGDSVPANAICEIAMCCITVTVERWAGVRTKDSSLDRRIRLHEAGGGGVSAAVFHVKANSSSKIEVYCEGNTTNVDFYLIGYWG